MKLKDMDIQELELMSYTDITYKLLKENQKSMTTAALFRSICDLLEFSDSDYENKIGDYSCVYGVRMCTTISLFVFSSSQEI